MQRCVVIRPAPCKLKRFIESPSIVPARNAVPPRRFVRKPLSLEPITLLTRPAETETHGGPETAHSRRVPALERIDPARAFSGPSRSGFLFISCRGFPTCMLPHPRKAPVRHANGNSRRIRADLRTMPLSCELSRLTAPWSARATSGNDSCASQPDYRDRNLPF
jgi:hypothetical protein